MGVVSRSQTAFFLLHHPNVKGKKRSGYTRLRGGATDTTMHFIIPQIYKYNNKIQRYQSKCFSLVYNTVTTCSLVDRVDLLTCCTKTVRLSRDVTSGNFRFDLIVKVDNVQWQGLLLVFILVIPLRMQ